MRYSADSRITVSNSVDFLRISGFHYKLDREIRSVLKKEIRQQDFVLGRSVREFESQWASFCDAKYAVGVGSGLSALELSLRALEVGPGDEVLVPSNTFAATWMAVSNIGAVPIPVPTSRADYNISPELLQSRISPKTRAIIPVHLYGYPADLKPILEIATIHKLKVIEDAAQAHGAEYHGQRIGAHSDAVAWSFYPGKNLGAFGDGGAVTTNSPQTAERIRLLSNYGSPEKYHHDLIGTNSRLDSLQAAILTTKLKYLELFNSRRKSIAGIYLQELAPLAGPGQPIVLPPSDSAAKLSSWHLFVIRVENRDKIRTFLQTLGIETGIHYPIPPGNQKAYAARYSTSVDVASIKDAGKLLSLPMGPHLSHRQVHQVCDALRQAVLRDG